MSEIRERLDARRFEPGFSGSLANAKLRDTRRLFNDRAAVHRLRGKNLSDPALFDNRVVTTSQTGSGKEILNIAQAANLVVEQVFALTGSIKSSRDRNSFAGRKLKRQISTAPMSFVRSLLRSWVSATSACLAESGASLPVRSPLLSAVWLACRQISAAASVRQNLVRCHQTIVDLFQR